MRRFYPVLLSLLIGVSVLPAAEEAGTGQKSGKAPESDFRSALAAALEFNAGLLNARDSLANAEQQFKAVDSDPLATSTQKVQAEQNLAIARAQLEAASFQTLQSFVAAYAAWYENARQIQLAEARAKLARRNVEIVELRVSLENASRNDLIKASSGLDTAQQNLAYFVAQTDSYRKQLASAMGLDSAALGGEVPGPAARIPEPPPFTAVLEELNAGLADRVPSVLQARANLTLDEIDVRNADNPYTAQVTLANAKIALQMSARNWESSKKNAELNLQSAFYAAQDAWSRIGLLKRDYETAKNQVTLDEHALDLGTLSAFSVENTKVALLAAELSYEQGLHGYWKALAALSYAGIVDLTGLLGADNTVTGSRAGP